MRPLQRLSQGSFVIFHRIKGIENLLFAYAEPHVGARLAFRVFRIDSYSQRLVIKVSCCLVVIQLLVNLSKFTIIL